MMNKFLRIPIYIMLACVSIENFAGKNDMKRDTTSDEFFVEAGGAGADTGSKVGLFTLMFLANKACVGWTSLKATAISLAASPVAPFVAGAAAAGGVCGAGYYVYRYFYPTSEKIASIEKNIERDRARAEHARLQADKKREERDLIKARQEFRSCLSSNLNAPRRKCVPVPCLEKAAAFVVRAPKEEVEQILSAFKECENH